LDKVAGNLKHFIANELFKCFNINSKELKYQAPITWQKYLNNPGKVPNPLSVYCSSLYKDVEEGM